MQKILTRQKPQLMLLLAIDGGFGRFDVMRRPRLDFNEAKDIPVPSDQIDIPSPPWRAKISRHHHIAQPAQMKVGSFFATPTSLLVRGR